MSMQTVISVVCDKCGERYEGEAGAKAREVRGHAKRDDWKVGKKADFCPLHAAAIRAEIKRLQSGILQSGQA